MTDPQRMGEAPEHPGPAAVRLPLAIAAAIREQVEAERPNEACGIVLGSGAAADGGRALRYRPCRNVHRSPATRFLIDPVELLALLTAAEPAGEVVWGIVHSHVARPAVPSSLDVEVAAWWPEAVHLVASLASSASLAGEPSLRAWRIVHGEKHEVILEPA